MDAEFLFRAAGCKDWARIIATMEREAKRKNYDSYGPRGTGKSKRKNKADKKRKRKK